jgi:hypothetical protein
MAAQSTKWCSRDDSFPMTARLMKFLTSYVDKFDMYVEDDYAAFVRYCFEDPLDAEIFRSRFEPKVERLKLGWPRVNLGCP